MAEINITYMINKMCEGKLNENEQMAAGIIMKALIHNDAVKPDYDEHLRPKCPNCGRALNTKMKNGKHIHQYCKVCGQHINWD